MTTLPILTIEAHSRCNCRCAMCDIWRTPEHRSFTPAQLAAQMDSLDQLGTSQVVFTGGEPLLNPDLFSLCEPLRSRGIRITLLSTGLLLERFAAQIREHMDEVIVSLDGPPEIHDRIRGVPGGFAALSRGIAALRSMPVAARCVVQRANCEALVETADAAGALGLQSISFLAVDISTAAFGRTTPWPLFQQDRIHPTQDQLPALESQIARLTHHPLVGDSPAHLSRIVRLCRAYHGLEVPVAPRCNAPFVSAYLRLDGSVQPCFFHEKFQAASEQNIREVLNGPAAVSFRESLDVETNPICSRCVCSLYRE